MTVLQIIAGYFITIVTGAAVLCYLEYKRIKTGKVNKRVQVEQGRFFNRWWSSYNRKNRLRW